MIAKKKNGVWRKEYYYAHSSYSPSHDLDFVECPVPTSCCELQMPSTSIAAKWHGLRKKVSKCKVVVGMLCSACVCEHKCAWACAATQPTCSIREPCQQPHRFYRVKLKLLGYKLSLKDAMQNVICMHSATAVPDHIFRAGSYSWR